MRRTKSELDDSRKALENETPPSQVKRRPAVYPAHLRPIVESAVRRLTSKSDSEYEDLVQSALEGVLAALETRGENRDHVPQWVSAVARNVAIDRLRARTRERRVFSRNDDESEREPASERSVEPEHLTHVRRELRRIDGALQGIGPARAMVLYLHDVLGYQLAEVAEALALTPAAAQSRLVRGRRALLRGMRSKLALQRSKK
jgi:RNA polymerase sigma factor (sigma-70 family)